MRMERRFDLKPGRRLTAGFVFLVLVFYFWGFNPWLTLVGVYWHLSRKYGIGLTDDATVHTLD